MVTMRHFLKNLFNPGGATPSSTRRSGATTATASAATTSSPPVPTARCAASPASSAPRPARPSASTSRPASTRTSTSRSTRCVYEIDMLRCIFCGYCVDACPEEAIIMTQQLRHGLLHPRAVDRRQGRPDEALHLRREPLGYRPRFPEEDASAPRCAATPSTWSTRPSRPRSARRRRPRTRKGPPRPSVALQGASLGSLGFSDPRAGVGSRPAPRRGEAPVG